jgi:Na+/melibiose symporter-like transporter
MSNNHPASTILRKPLSPIRQALLSFYWFATNAHWSAIMMVLMPSQIKAAVGNDVKGLWLGLVLGAGALISMIAAPALGALSDRIKLPGGRRKPWVVIGTIANLIGLVGLGFAIQPGNPSSLVLWTAVFLFV